MALRLFFGIMTLFACVEIHGQTFSNPGYKDHSIFADWGEYAVDTLDMASYLIHYNARICTDTLTHEQFSSEYALLIGSKMTKFVPSRKYEYDIQRMKGAQYALLKNEHYLFIYDAVYNDFFSGNTRFTARVGSQDYLYEEPIPTMQWSFLDNVLNIDGYECHLAECDFRGRHYFAWYCVEIPIPYGPYKFWGLPGLILSLYDSEKHYEFTFSELESVESPIIRFEYDYIVTDRKSINKASNEYLHNPVVYSYHHKLKGGWSIDPAKYTEKKNIKYQYDIIERQ